MAKKVQYVGESKRIFSPRIWADCPIEAILGGRVDGYFYQDDFRAWFGDGGAAATERQDYTSYGDTGVTILQLATEHEGVVEVAGNDADNDEGSIQHGGATSTSFIISDTAADAKKLWFEARVRKASVADNALALFVGLAEEGLAAADTLIDNTGEIADKDMIGFHNLHASGEEIDFTYNKAGGTIQVPMDNGGTLVAAAFINLGFKYDPEEDTAKRIKLYIDNVESSSYVTGANIATANFPDGEELAMLFATKVGAAAESKAAIDWWAVCQLG